MKTFAIVFGAAGLALFLTPAAAQIVHPIIVPPPCSGHNCPQHWRGPPMTTVPKTQCPPGTVYNPKKGTCKVLTTGSN
jgi:hypothetical protein